MRRSNLKTFTWLPGYFQSFSSNLWSTHTLFFIYFNSFATKLNIGSKTESLNLTNHLHAQKSTKNFILSVKFNDNFEIEYDQCQL